MSREKKNAESNWKAQVNFTLPTYVFVDVFLCVYFMTEYSFGAESCL